MEIREHAVRIARDIDRRNSTDIRIHPNMVAVVLLFFLGVSLFQLFTAPSSGFDTRLQSTGVFITGTGVLISIMYLLVSRRYSHEERDLALMRDLMEYARDLLEHYGVKEYHYLNAMRSCIRADSGLDAFRIRFIVSVVPAALGLIFLLFNANNENVFVITCALFGASFIINLLLLLQSIAFPRKHEKVFVTFSDAFVDAMARCGVRVKGYEPVIGYRPFWLFLLLSVVSLGIFSVFWLYRSMVDMNRHMDEQWVFENEVIESLKRF